MPKEYFRRVFLGFYAGSWFLYRIVENMIFRRINFCNRGIKLGRLEKYVKTTFFMLYELLGY